MEQREIICRFYFDLGLSYAEILECLSQIHNIIISMRTLKRIFKIEGLYRRKKYTDILEVAEFIEEQLNHGSQLSYRSMHLRCVQNGLRVPRHTISILMQILDPRGIQCRLKHRLRRRRYFARGPNFLWHIDSYDKLKQYGICINGCIDGFSRNLIWLNAYKTSSNPSVIAGYFIEAVNKNQGCPKLMRGDMGTENGHVACMENFLTGREGSFIYGKSTGNQRIEMFWSFFRRQCSQFWIDILSDIKNNGYFTGNFIDTNLLQFSFLDLIQHDIDRMIIEWNTHIIRPKKCQTSPSGRPMIMYELPHVYNTIDYLVRVLPILIATCRDECTFCQEKPCDKDCFELFMIYLEELDKEIPADVDEAIGLYMAIRTELYDDL